MKKSKPEIPKLKLEPWEEKNSTIAKVHELLLQALNRAPQDQRSGILLRWVRSLLHQTHPNWDAYLLAYVCALSAQSKGELCDIKYCRVCGCTEYTACMTKSGPCSWVGAESLCSACTGIEADFVLQEKGNPNEPFSEANTDLCFGVPRHEKHSDRSGAAH